MGVLYKLTSPSGKSYIGITSGSLPDRWRAHRAHAKRCKTGCLQKAIRKYGAASFQVEVVARATDYGLLKVMESWAIEHFGTKVPRGYNMTDGGDGMVGVVVTDEGRKRRSAAQRKSFADPERKRIHLESQRSSNLREKRRANAIALASDPVRKRKRSEDMKARWSDPEARQRMLAPRPEKPKINDGLTRWQRHRLRNLDGYRKRKAAGEARRRIRLAASTDGHGWYDL